MPKGFTLLETLVAAGIIGMIVLLHAMFAPEGRLRVQETERARNLIWNELVRARDSAALGTGGADWGVAFFPHSFTSFSGPNYASRNPDFDATFTVPDYVTISGPSEIVFLRPDGRTADNYIITVAGGLRAFAISISPQGIVETQSL